jgi:hypothetical protein
MALPIDIADAVVAELVQGAFSQDISPARMVLPSFSLKDLAHLHVTVVPKAVESSGSTRSACQHDVQVDIGIQKKLGADLDTEVAALCELVEEIATFLRKRPLSATPYARWLRSTNDPIYVQEHLANERVFTSVLTLTYRALA